MVTTYLPAPGTTPLPKGTQSSDAGGSSYTCRYCRREWVVPSLARSCEAKCEGLR